MALTDGPYSLPPPPDQTTEELTDLKILLVSIPCFHLQLFLLLEGFEVEGVLVTQM